jgi:acetylglutamate kinase
VQQPYLIKIGGAELEDGPILGQLVDALVPLAQERPLVIVHGGGGDIARLQERLGLKPSFVDGLRVTDADSLQVAVMVLSGLVNKRLTARLVGRGVRAIGISGVDMGLLMARKLDHPAGDLGRVGEITQVNVARLSDLLNLGLTPVISPISLGDDGRPYNVNADHAALALASALRVPEMILLTNVPGVLADGAVLPELPAEVAETMITSKVINGGMIPKVRSALAAIDAGVGAARITDLAGLAAGSGTRVLATTIRQHA